MKNRMLVPGSEKRMLSNAKVTGKLDPKKEIEITILVRRRASGAGERAQHRDMMVLGTRLPEDREYFGREEFATARGADPADIERIDAFAHEHNLTVVQSSIPKRTVKLAGTIADLATAFGARVNRYRVGRRIFRGRTGALSVPKELAQIVVGVFGLDNRPVARPHYRRLDRLAASRNRTRTARARPRNAPDGSFTPPE